MFYVLYGIIELLFSAVKEFYKHAPDFSLWISLSGLLAVVSAGLFVLLGKLVCLDWSPRWWLGSLAGLALPISFLLFLLLPASTYLKPGVLQILKTWEGDFQHDEVWNEESFRRQYWAVRALKKADGTPLEDFTGYPPPEKEGTRLPANLPESKAIISEIESTRVAEHFQAHLVFLTKLLWTKEKPLPEVLRQDMDSFFRDHPGTPYYHAKAVQLAGVEMRSLLEQKIGRIVLTTRIILVALLLLLWLPLYAWAVYDAWKKLEPIRG